MTYHIADEEAEAMLRLAVEHLQDAKDLLREVGGRSDAYFDARDEATKGITHVELAIDKAALSLGLFQIHRFR